MNRWYVAVGDKVAAGDVVAEIEAGTTSYEIEAAHDATIQRILVAEGSTGVPSTQPLAALTPPPVTPPADETSTGNGPPNTGVGHDADGASADRTAGRGRQDHLARRVIISPRARRAAVEAGLEPVKVKGSGPGARITLADIQHHLAAYGSGQDVHDAQSAGEDATAGAAIGASQIPMPIRTTKAGRITLGIECRIDGLLRTRDAINRSRKTPTGSKPEVTLACFYIKALAAAVIAASSQGDPSDLENAAIAYLAPARDQSVTMSTRDIASASLHTFAAIIAADHAGQPPGRAHRSSLSMTLMDFSDMQIRTAEGCCDAMQPATIMFASSERRAIVSGERLNIATVVSCSLTVDPDVVGMRRAAKILASLRQSLESPDALIP